MYVASKRGDEVTDENTPACEGDRLAVGLEFRRIRGRCPGCNAWTDRVICNGVAHVCLLCHRSWTAHPGAVAVAS